MQFVPPYLDERWGECVCSENKRVSLRAGAASEAWRAAKQFPAVRCLTHVGDCFVADAPRNDIFVLHGAPQGHGNYSPAGKRVTVCFWLQLNDRNRACLPKLSALLGAGNVSE